MEDPVTNVASLYKHYSVLDTALCLKYRLFFVHDVPGASSAPAHRCLVVNILTIQDQYCNDVFVTDATPPSPLRPSTTQLYLPSPPSFPYLAITDFPFDLKASSFGFKILFCAFG
jgi:hypothetical protein